MEGVLMKSASKHTTSVNWKAAQQKAALTAKWAVTMTNEGAHSMGCISNTLAARHVLRKGW